MEGIEDVFVYEGSVNGDVFEYFVRTTLLPLLMPYDGQNKHSVVVMDNASIHHLETVQDMILGVGALIRFLPPYSPDLNPIEEVFSKAKRYLKANDMFLPSNTITTPLCSRCISNCDSGRLH